MKWADYCVSKLTLDDRGFIESIIYYQDFGESLGHEIEGTRAWMVRQVEQGKTFCSIKKNIHGNWNLIGNFTYNNFLFSWHLIPKNLTKRKIFKSYYHSDDQVYKKFFENLFGDLVINKSVEDGDINEENSDDYVKQLIQKGYLSDTTVLIVLIGPNTRHRKHIDWEISGALNHKVGDKYAGILGLLLPNHPNYSTDHYTSSLLPGRLADNLKSGYAILRNWTDDRIKMQEYIELAQKKRSTNADNIDNSRLQMTKNTNE
ncbi:TIR domain-containing protein [Pedobacter aquatilis]|uniref:TIR domain-containing protein n=1 Tax=Pedobacter aquatilis TaxID=351343 RepID=UPI00292CC94B|nr:TIR domain-containing protein [Pedobacter aquatilis]